MTNESKYFWAIFFLFLLSIVNNYSQRATYATYIDEVSKGVVELRRQNDVLIEIINANN